MHHTKKLRDHTLNVRGKILKSLEENIGKKNLCDAGLGKDSLNRMQKAQPRKEK